MIGTGLLSLSPGETFVYLLFIAHPSAVHSYGGEGMDILTVLVRDAHGGYVARTRLRFVMDDEGPLKTKDIKEGPFTKIFPDGSAEADGLAFLQRQIDKLGTHPGVKICDLVRIDGDERQMFEVLKERPWFRVTVLAKGGEA